MTKKLQQQRIAKRGNDMAIEQIVAQDDSLLPSASELSAYKGVDETIIPWLLAQSKVEQEHRHKTDDDKIKVMNRAITGDMLFIVLLFFIILIFIGASVVFVWFDKNVAGSIFGVTGIIGVYFIYKHFYKK